MILLLVTKEIIRSNDSFIFEINGYYSVNALGTFLRANSVYCNLCNRFFAMSEMNCIIYIYCQAQPKPKPASLFLFSGNSVATRKVYSAAKYTFFNRKLKPTDHRKELDCTYEIAHQRAAK